MKLLGCLGIILAFACLQGAAAESNDTVWLCRNTTPEVLWVEMSLADTFPDNRGKFAMVDTGDAIEGPYVNFNYQFGNPNPGYAGFKFYWDDGIMSFWVEEYDSLVLWHKGPLPGHKVKMVWGQGSAGCGTPINYETFAEFKSSTVWKRESFGFPAKRGDVSKYPDSPFVRIGLFELRMLIYNDEGSTSPTSEKGCLKIDNMFFKKGSNAAIRNPHLVQKSDLSANFFVPTVSGKVTLSIFSMQGEQLFREAVDVSAGTRYSVSRFAQKNSNLPAKWINCVQIIGAGVNITRKVVR